MNSYPIDPNDEENQIETCPICSAPANMECHPACPQVQVSEELQVEGMDFGVFISNALFSATEDYFNELAKKQHKELLVDRAEQFKEDWLEVGEFAKALFDAGCLLKAEDVIYFITHTYKFTPQYLIWLELGKPKENDELYGLFKSEALNRRK